MFVLHKKFTFEAAHRLPNHDGKCARLHGHSFVMELEVGGPQLHRDGPQAGMVIDYGRLSALVDPWVDEFLDHQYLNDTTQLANPTSEELARWIYEHLVEHIAVPLRAVTVFETCTSSCRYTSAIRE